MRNRLQGFGALRSRLTMDFSRSVPMKQGMLTACTIYNPVAYRAYTSETRHSGFQNDQMIDWD